jgi:hypothetical protein
MKKVFFACMLSVFFFLILLVPANAQDKGQKKIHVVVEENGTVITDTLLFFDKAVSEEEIQAVISGLTEDISRPCQARNQQDLHCDTVVYKCRHMQNGEPDSLPEVSGKSFSHTDTCRHAEGSHGPCMNHTEKVGAGQEPCKHIEKEIIRTGEPAGEESVIIGDNGDITIRSGHNAGEKCIKVIVTEEGDKAEKTIILESPAETEKKSKKEK